MTDSTATVRPARVGIWLVLLAAAATFGLTAGTRQTMGLFLGPLNTATGLGLANISLAFAFGQLFSHQIGGFLGAWLGGQVFVATGSYDWVWTIDIVLAVGAALVNLPIREAPLTKAVPA